MKKILRLRVLLPVILILAITGVIVAVGSRVGASVEGQRRPQTQQRRAASRAAGANSLRQSRTNISNEEFENFDIRTDKSKPVQAKLAQQRQKLAPQQTARKTARVQSMRRAQEASSQAIPNLDVSVNPLTGGFEIIGVRSAGHSFLTAPSTRPNEMIVREFVSRHAAVYGLTAAQAGQLITTADYANPDGNLAWIRLEQRFNDLPVFAGELSAAFTAEGELVRTISGLAAGVVERELAVIPAISAAEAVARAAATIGVTVDPNSLVLKSASFDGRHFTFEPGPFAEEIKVEAVYFPLETGLANLAWSMVLWQHKPAYYTVVDAEQGELFYRKNITADQSQSATYSIYNNDSPAPLSPTNATPGSGIQGAGIGRTTFTVVSELPAFDNLGWITDGGNTTTGNNVDAGLDFLEPDGIDPAARPVGSPFRVFNFAYNPPPLGSDQPTGANYRAGVITNMFFWSNRYHDLLYQLGFTEAARNFQNNNFGRGGLGNDYVRAEAQDYSGTNNANFATPADGSLPRMQMFIFNSPNPERDGSIDQDIMLHELTHGTSSRLHANGSGLTGTQARGMGEGWSDFYARALLSSASEDVNGVYAMASYLMFNFSGNTDNYYYGYRRFPYAVKTKLGANGKPHNPLTFADIDVAQINITDGAFPPSPIFGDAAADEVHALGEVWCMALLEVRARLITRLGYATGNQRALQIVTDGMKLDPANPTLLDARNSILTADCAGFSGNDELDIWAGFAARGMGQSAWVITGTTVVESFDMPNLTIGNVTVSDSNCNNNGAADPGETVTLTVPLVNPYCATSVTGATASMVGGGTANYGTINAGATASQNFSFPVPAATPCGSTLTLTFNLNSSLGAVTRTYALQIGQQTVSLAQNFDTLTPPALPAGWASAVTGSGVNWVTTTEVADSAPNAIGTENPATTGSSTLTTSNITIAGSAARLSFRQIYVLENGFDGGVLEIKIGAGAFTDILAAGGSFVAGGYTQTLTAAGCAANPNPLAGRAAWTGSSVGFISTTVNLPAAVTGQPIQLRWRAGFDCVTGGDGWAIDNLSLTTSSCAPANCGGACPTVSNINPTSGQVGSTVTITGANFTGVTAVKFSNSVTATFTVVNATTITATVPAGAITGAITISKTGCTDVQTASFTVTTPPSCPTVTNLNPTSGLVGSTVTITGTNFTGVTAVKFSNNVTATFTVVNAATITATVPSGAVTGPLTISKTGCTDVQTASFTVTTPPACPTVSNINPASGLVGSSVTITGTNFTGVTAVKFSNSVTATFTVVNATTISATVPSGATTGPLTISKPGCTDVQTASFTVTTPPACPTVSNINPTSGLVGSTVTITGTNFTGVTGVKFSNNVSATFTVVNATTITATVPSSAVSGPLTLSKTGCTDVQTAVFTVPVGNPCINPTPITMGQTVNGQLSAGGCLLSDGSYADLYSFSASAGQQIAISLSSTAFDTYLFLRDPASNFIAQDNNGGGGTNSRIPSGSGFITLPVTGTYTIFANSFLASQTGSYSLTLTGGGISNGLMFYPLPSPVRLLDTRLGASPNACSQPNAPLAGGSARTQLARNFCGLPATAQALTGNITTVQSGGGYLTLYPSGAVQPTVASTNYGPNEIINNVFTVGLGNVDGAFNIFAANTTEVVVDVTGYYAPPSGAGLYFHALPAPVRLLETRAGQPVGCVKPGAPLAGGVDALQTATTACTGIPAAARALVGNATTVSPQSGGYLTLFPADAARPLIASSNYDTNQIVNGPFTTGLSALGQFKVFTVATTELVIDLLGYYSAEATDANGAGLLFTPLAHPVRLLETRAGQPVGCFKPSAPLNGGQVYTQTARGLCDGLTLPAAALGVVGNATVVFPAAGGYLTLWPSSAAQPTVATANYNGGQVVNRHFIVGLGNADGAFKMFSSATSHLVVDLSGYFAP